MAELLPVVSKAGQGVIDLADHQILTVIETSHEFFRASDSTIFSMSRRLLRASPQNVRSQPRSAAEWRPNGTLLRSVPDYKRILG